jgi:RNA polymerase sigma-70 factor, ECF subfamily
MGSTGHSSLSMTSAHAAASDVPSGEPARPTLAARASPDFEAIYREHFRFVWRSVCRLGIDPALVDDVVQETFLVVHRRLATFEGRSSTKTWLYGIVRRVIADHRRSQRRKPAFEGSSAKVDRAADVTVVGPEGSVEQAEKVRLLHRLLDELDPSKREVFILAEFEGMTTLEMSEALDVNMNTVSTRLRAARQRFEEALARATAPQEGSPR